MLEVPNSNPSWYSIKGLCLLKYKSEIDSRDLYALAQHLRPATVSCDDRLAKEQAIILISHSTTPSKWKYGISFSERRGPLNPQEGYHYVGLCLAIAVWLSCILQFER